MKHKILERETYGGGTEVVMTKLETFSPLGELAVHFIDKWGVVAGIEDGEDAAGRAKLRLLKPDEVVRRGIDMAKEVYAQLTAEGWMVELPEPKESQRKRRTPEERAALLGEQLNELQDAMPKAD